ncbi:hypothetical protein PPL_07073 [Heterostelium album PN500]|uniref:Transmembrane protein n=1 Tax=Heterostelium pallidum (strain ATCC 26659 / Pp 5 / PN500) TaxID=670386 RepID=D3BEB7_HETP5|nr:hypothetical protein PPL_07073 [Heterostelium album PN500]EFA80248.1 hypothetical protein PPL_07073 [Heterostelium album PN500]|eukprot:XP_020432368.1 hypothetical protein PPL_07073 [Heterostelium album PN500]
MKTYFTVLFIFFITINNIKSEVAYWNGTDYSNFMTGTNWDPSNVPSTSSTLFIISNSSVLDTDNVVIYSLILGSPLEETPTLIIQNGASFSVTNTTTIYHSATLQMTNGSLVQIHNLQQSGNIVVNNGTLNVLGALISNDSKIEFRHGHQAIEGLFEFDTNSNFEVVNSETEITGNYLFRNHSSLSIDNSVVTFSKSNNLIMMDQTEFSISNSKLDIIGLATIGSTVSTIVQDSTLSIESQNLNVSSSPKVQRSTLNVSGNLVFGPSSVVEMTDTILNINPTANVTVNFELTGKNLTINILGNLFFAKQVSKFICDNCTVNINGNGLFRFNLFAFANITNTYIYNNANVFTAAKILKQTNGSIALVGGTLFANNTIEIESGSLYGNGNVYGNISNQGTIGNQASLNTTDNITILGNLHQNKGQIVLNINLDRHSHLNVSRLFNASNVNIVVYVSDDTPSNTNITLINFDEFQGNINSVTIRTFNPSTGKPTTFNKCKYQSQRNEKSFAVLVGDDYGCDRPGNGGDKVPPGAIFGIVIGFVVAAALIALILYHRTKIRLFFKKSYTKQIQLSKK